MAVKTSIASRRVKNQDLIHASRQSHTSGFSLRLNALQEKCPGGKNDQMQVSYVQTSIDEMESKFVLLIVVIKLS